METMFGSAVTEYFTFTIFKALWNPTPPSTSNKKAKVKQENTFKCVNKKQTQNYGSSTVLPTATE